MAVTHQPGAKRLEADSKQRTASTTGTGEASRT
jgi:hypothetical protein